MRITLGRISTAIVIAPNPFFASATRKPADSRSSPSPSRALSASSMTRTSRSWTAEFSTLSIGGYPSAVSNWVPGRYARSL